jgi:hypothetical protein
VHCAPYVFCRNWEFYLDESFPARLGTFLPRCIAFRRNIEGRVPEQYDFSATGRIRGVICDQQTN